MEIILVDDNSNYDSYGKNIGTWVEGKLNPRAFSAFKMVGRARKRDKAAKMVVTKMDTLKSGLDQRFQ